MKKYISIILCLFLLTAVLSACSASGNSFVYPDTIYGEYKDDGLSFIEDEDVPLAQFLFWDGDDESIVYDENTDDETLDRLIDALLSDKYVVDELIVKFKSPSEVANEEQLKREIAKLEYAGYIEALDTYVIKVEDAANDPELSLRQYIKKLIRNTYIEYVEPNYVAAVGSSPNDANYKNQSNAMNLINAPAGWAIANGGGPLVAIIDSGMAVHPDLPTPRSSYSAVAGLSPNNDTLGHGSRVAGIIGAIGNNKIGIAGVNWSANIMAVKVDTSTGSMSGANVAKGITWAADNGARVINISVGFITDSATIRNAINYAYNKGCAIFAATGNSGKATVDWPARYDNVFGVGSSSDGRTRYSASNYGDGLDVVAPGASLNTTTHTSAYVNVTGTSFATPQAAALASLIWAVNPGLTNAQVYDLIRKGASGGGKLINSEIGYGIINIGKTLELAGGGAGKPEPEPPKYNAPPKITLTGQQEITINVGDSYTEPGYSAVDCLGANLTASVKVTNNINKNIAGVYAVTYEVADAGGNNARASRTVFVKELPKPPAGSPTLAIIGSNPLTLEVGVAYIEQSAKATDYDGKDISSLVRVTGTPDTKKAGTYTVTYEVTNSAGNKTTATRTVQVVAKAEVKKPTSYGFSGSGKAVTNIKHTGIVANAEGFMDLKVTAIDKNMTITVELYDTINNNSVFTDKFSAAGSKQYSVGAGTYELRVTISAANGSSTYKVDLLMP